jgi:hypothetical protein
VTEEAHTTEDACGEGARPDLWDWVAGPAEEPVRWDVLQEWPEVRDRLRAAGYEGAFWFEVRPLSAAEEERRITASRYIQRDSAQLTFDEHRHWRFTFLHQIEAYRVPEQQADGTFVEQAGGGGPEDAGVLYALGPRIMAALKRKLREVNGELPAQRRGLDQAKKR